MIIIVPCVLIPECNCFKHLRIAVGTPYDEKIVKEVVYVIQLLTDTDLINLWENLAAWRNIINSLNGFSLLI